MSALPPKADMLTGALSMSALCHKRTLRSDSAHGVRGWDAPCPRDLASEVSKVAVVRVDLG